ncbi:MAG: DUF393 domain-containing protein [Pseudomonadota bacterium]
MTELMTAHRDRTGSSRTKVWYDGGCPICTREIAVMRRLDRDNRIDFVDVSDADASCPIDREALLARFHVRENDEIVSGAAAFAAMWRQIPLLRPFGLAARNRAVLWLLERLYQGFLRVRTALHTLIGLSKKRLVR